MPRCCFGFLVAGSLFAAAGLGMTVGSPITAVADEAKDEATKKDEAIKKDRKLYEGTWQIVALVVNGEKSGDEDARKLSVLNGADGSWSLRSEDKEVNRGRNILDPTKKPKTIDVIVIEGDKETQTFQGIYEITETTRRLCFVPPGIERPTEFASTPGSERFLVTFEREKTK